MNELQSRMIEAIEAIASNKVENSNATLTIKAEIVEDVNPVKGIYKARYLSDVFEVYASGGLRYAVGSIVYILVPDGDFNKDKMIVGSAGAAYESTIQIGESKQYYDLSDNLCNAENISLWSYKENKGVKNQFLDTKLLNSYLADTSADTICFSFDLTTHLSQEQQVKQGNYGLALKFQIIQKYMENPTPIEETLEISTNAGTVFGNPYALEFPTRQNLYYKFDGSIFEILPETVELHYYSNDFIIANPLISKFGPFDIIFENISITACKEVEEGADQGYGLHVQSTQGRTFSKGDAESSKTLTPILTYKGVEIESSKFTFVQWFIEDESIRSGGDGYYPGAGAGWRSLNEVDENGVAKSMLKFTLARPEGYSTKYKCVVTHDKTNISSEFIILNMNSESRVSLAYSIVPRVFADNTPSVEAAQITATVSEVLEEGAQPYYIYAWSRYDKFGRPVATNFIAVEESQGTAAQTVFIPMSIVDSSNTIKCSVKRDLNGILTDLGSAEIVVAPGVNEQYRLETNADRVYKYDANGNAPTSPSYAGTMIQIDALGYKIYRPDGSEISESAYGICKYKWSFPKNSLFILDADNSDDEYYYITGTGKIGEDIKYQINSRYDAAKADIGPVLLEVDFDGTIFTEKINIIFLKDGENGTNGTSYTATIVPNDVDKLHLVYVRNEKEWYWLNNDGNKVKVLDVNPSVHTRTFLDGEEVSGQVGISYQWYDANFNDSEGNPCLYIDSAFGNIYAIKDGAMIEPEKKAENIHIIQARVQTDKSKEQYVYAYYPVETTFVDNIEDTIPIIENGFSEILYSSSRNQPVVNGEKTFICKGVKGWSTYTYGNIVSLSKSEEDKVIVSVIPQLEGENIKASIKAHIGTSTTLKPIIVLINRYGDVNMNDWDGNKFIIGEDGEYAFAPQFAAGIKDKENAFTGVYMGQTNKHVGLLGKNKGEDTFFINARDGGFSFGKDKIVFDPINKDLTLSDVVIKWKSKSAEGEKGVEGPDVSDVNGLEDTLNNIDNDFTTFQTQVKTALTGNPATEIGNNYIISPNIGGGYLFLTANEGKNTVEINPNGSSVQDSTGKYTSDAGKIINVKYNDESIFYVNTVGSAFFKGEIQADKGTFKGDISGATGTFTGGIKTSILEVTGGIIKIGDALITEQGFEFGSEKSSGNSTLAGWKIYKHKIVKNGVGISCDANNYAFWAGGKKNGSASDSGSSPDGTYEDAGKFTATFAVKQDGSMYSTAGQIGGFNITSTDLFAGGTSIETSTIGLTSYKFRKKIGNEVLYELAFAIGNNFGVTGDGILHCSNAVISGEISADEGYVGDWSISEGALSATGVPRFFMNGLQIETRYDADLILSPKEVTISWGSYVTPDDPPVTMTTDWYKIINRANINGWSGSIIVTGAYLNDSKLSSDYKLTFSNGILTLVNEI